MTVTLKLSPLPTVAVPVMVGVVLAVLWVLTVGAVGAVTSRVTAWVSTVPETLIRVLVTRAWIIQSALWLLLSVLLQLVPVDVVSRIRTATERGLTPAANYAKRCEQCSLVARCMPKAMGRAARAEHWFTRMVGGE